MIDALSDIFDKHSANFRKGLPKWEIIEPDAGAQLKKVTITGTGNFDVIENPFYKSWSHVTTDRSSFLKDSDCDSTAFYIDESGKKLIFVDLKSSLSSDNLQKAIKQDFFSFLKMQMAFALCKDYRLKDFDLYFLMACPMWDDDLGAEIKDNLSQNEMLGYDDDYLSQCLKDYFYGGNEWTCKISDLPFIHKSTLHRDILDKNVKFKILTTADATDSELTFSF